MLTDYTIRLPNQFQDSAGIKAIIDAFFDRIDDNNGILEYALALTLDTAEGVWLDEIGEIVGIPRLSEHRTDAEIFATCSVSDFPGDSALGYSDLADPQGGYLVGLDEFGYPTISTGTPIGDTLYRAAIRAKIDATYRAPTIYEIYDWIKTTFGVESYVYTCGPCEIAIELDEYLTFFERWQIYNCAPIAAGVRIGRIYNPPSVPPVVLTQTEDDE